MKEAVQKALEGARANGIFKLSQEDDQSANLSLELIQTIIHELETLPALTEFHLTVPMHGDFANHFLTSIFKMTATRSLRVLKLEHSIYTQALQEVELNAQALPELQEVTLIGEFGANLTKFLEFLKNRKKIQSLNLDIQLSTFDHFFSVLPHFTELESCDLNFTGTDDEQVAYSGKINNAEKLLAATSNVNLVSFRVTVNAKFYPAFLTGQDTPQENQNRVYFYSLVRRNQAFIRAKDLFDLFGSGCNDIDTFLFLENIRAAALTPMLRHPHLNAMLHRVLDHPMFYQAIVKAYRNLANYIYRIFSEVFYQSPALHLKAALFLGKVLLATADNETELAQKARIREGIAFLLKAGEDQKLISEADKYITQYLIFLIFGSHLKTTLEECFNYNHDEFLLNILEIATVYEQHFSGNSERYHASIDLQNIDSVLNGFRCASGIKLLKDKITHHFFRKTKPSRSYEEMNRGYQNVSTAGSDKTRIRITRTTITHRRTPEQSTESQEQQELFPVGLVREDPLKQTSELAALFRQNLSDKKVSENVLQSVKKYQKGLKTVYGEIDEVVTDEKSIPYMDNRININAILARLLKRRLVVNSNGFFARQPQLPELVTCEQIYRYISTYNQVDPGNTFLVFNNIETPHLNISVPLPNVKLVAINAKLNTQEILIELINMLKSNNLKTHTKSAIAFFVSDMLLYNFDGKIYADEFYRLLQNLHFLNLPITAETLRNCFDYLERIKSTQQDQAIAKLIPYVIQIAVIYVTYVNEIISKKKYTTDNNFDLEVLAAKDLFSQALIYLPDPVLESFIILILKEFDRMSEKEYLALLIALNNLPSGRLLPNLVKQLFPRLLAIQSENAHTSIDFLRGILALLSKHEFTLLDTPEDHGLLMEVMKHCFTVEREEPLPAVLLYYVCNYIIFISDEPELLQQFYDWILPLVSVTDRSNLDGKVAADLAFFSRIILVIAAEASRLPKMNITIDPKIAENLLIDALDESFDNAEQKDKYDLAISKIVNDSVQTLEEKQILSRDPAPKAAI